ncbi:MAG: ferrous iron transport protein B, partial [Eubacterium sp.]
MGIKIALAGNPNSGKTTLFNALTGSNQFVGNWPGVTVEKKEGKLKKDSNIIVTDLPGIYSLSPYTLEEVVARNYLINEHPDAILNIVDGTNLERNLYLTTQLIELGIPVVIAINMMDVVRKNGDEIHIDELSKKLGCRIVEISALKLTGISDAVEAAIDAAERNKPVPKHCFCGVVEHALAHIEEAAVHDMPAQQQRWYAVKIFERDKKVLEQLNLSENVLAHIEEDIKSAEAELDDDAESIITNERYNYVTSVIKSTYVRKNAGKLTVSDKIDKIVTNRILGLPIFALVMFGVYYISVTTVGSIATDWTNDVLFGQIVPTAVSSLLNAVSCAEWLQSLILDGIIGGVGAVLGFVPQIFVLFIFLAFLESCGYMSRVAFIMDRIFRRFGLSGKSFIPMLIGTGCG